MEQPGKPTWKKGDVLALPQELCEFGSVNNGCAVFIAEHNPTFRDHAWYYGWRPASEVRPATRADVDRLQKIIQPELARVCEQVANLNKVAELVSKSDKSGVATT